jgi:hypothetical protein
MGHSPRIGGKEMVEDNKPKSSQNFSEFFKRSISLRGVRNLSSDFASKRSSKTAKPFRSEVDDGRRSLEIANFAAFFVAKTLDRPIL